MEHTQIFLYEVELDSRYIINKRTPDIDHRGLHISARGPVLTHTGLYISASGPVLTHTRYPCTTGYKEALFFKKSLRQQGRNEVRVLVVEERTSLLQTVSTSFEQVANQNQ